MYPFEPFSLSKGTTMPIILIETRAGWITEPAAVIAAVHSAVQHALKVPDWDRTVRLIEHQPDHFPPPPGKGERFTLVQVTMIQGRSMQANRTLKNEFAERFSLRERDDKESDEW